MVVIVICFFFCPVLFTNAIMKMYCLYVVVVLVRPLLQAELNQTIVSSPKHELFLIYSPIPGPQDVF